MVEGRGVGRRRGQRGRGGIVEARAGSEQSRSSASANCGSGGDSESRSGRRRTAAGLFPAANDIKKSGRPDGQREHPIAALIGAWGAGWPTSGGWKRKVMRKERGCACAH